MCYIKHFLYTTSEMHSFSQLSILLILNKKPFLLQNLISFNNSLFTIFLLISIGDLFSSLINTFLINKPN